VPIELGRYHFAVCSPSHFRSFIGYHGKDVFHLVGDSWTWVASYGRSGVRLDPNRMDEDLGHDAGGFPTDALSMPDGSTVYGI
jgi:hypothetical protein